MTGCYSQGLGRRCGGETFFLLSTSLLPPVILDHKRGRDLKKKKWHKPWKLFSKVLQSFRSRMKSKLLPKHVDRFSFSCHSSPGAVSPEGGKPARILTLGFHLGFLSSSTPPLTASQNELKFQQDHDCNTF